MKLGISISESKCSICCSPTDKPTNRCCVFPPSGKIFPWIANCLFCGFIYYWPLSKTRKGLMKTTFLVKSSQTLQPFQMTQTTHTHRKTKSMQIIDFFWNPHVWGQAGLSETSSLANEFAWWQVEYNFIIEAVLREGRLRPATDISNFIGILFTTTQIYCCFFLLLFLRFICVSACVVLWVGSFLILISLYKSLSLNDVCFRAPCFLSVLFNLSFCRRSVDARTLFECQKRMGVAGEGFCWLKCLELFEPKWDRKATLFLL